MTIETKRLILRPWREDDAGDLYEFAKDPRIGPAAGWPVHKSAQDSREIIRSVLAVEGTYALTLKGDDRAIGSLGIMSVRNMPEYEGEPEIGYWLAVPFWGQGLVPEAVNETLRILFEEKKEERVWCGHYEGNEKSRRVIEKCGFKFVSKQEVDVPLLNERRTEYTYCITCGDWFK